jgi:3-deoxy-D-manno-octulosonic-acid transferase
MGKSFPPGGGQNPLEPARLACAVATGPATQNFIDPVTILRAAGGLGVVDDVDALTGWVDRMLRDPAARQATGAAAQAVASAHASLPARTAARLAALMA